MRKRKRDTQAAGFTSATTRPRLTAIDIQQKEFRLAFRGYNERDVDEFLDLVTEELAAFTGENRRLQDHADPNLVPPAGADASWASREAEGILERARADAAEIVSEAEAQAAAILATGAGAGDRRGVIAPYLNREREFLQSLGQLVQQHAESVRRMVKATKEQAAAVPSPSPSPNAAAASRPASEGREEGSQVIRIEPAETTEQTGAAPTESLAEGAPSEPAPGRHRSVRELFWGEE